MDVPLPVALAPAEQVLLGVPGPVLHGALLAGFLGLFGWILARRIALLRGCAPDPRLDRPWQRLGLLLRVGLLQSRQPRYRVAGTLHILLFAGFLVLLLRSLALIGEGFSAEFTLPGFGGGVGTAYASVKDWTAAAVLACVVALAVRRAFFRPARYHDRTLAGRPHGPEAYVILGWIGLLMVADAVYEGSHLVATGAGAGSMPLASLAGGILGGLPDGAREAMGLAGFWVHDVALLGFLCYLPLSKHFHVLTSLPNVFLGRLPPGGRVKPPRYDVPDSASIEHLGVGRLEDFTWKQVLDVYTCTDCGRCSDHCPAYATGTPLSPRAISVKCRDHAYAALPALRAAPPAEGRPPLLGSVLTEAEIWACTTCGACEEACPVLIEYVDKIVDLRRRLVEEGRVPPGIQKALAEVEKRGNPYGKMPRKRAEGLAGPGTGVRLVPPGGKADLLWFTDSGVAYDPRLLATGKAFAGILAAVGADVGILGPAEADSGHEARRVGEEGLFEDLREKNLAALGARAFDRVVTTDPHAWNALRSDYALDRPVLHHTQVLRDLVRAGRLPLRAPADGRTWTFHDPCYLGRHGGVFDAPREVLAAIPGLPTVEMPRSRGRSFCCGGGSLYLFHEAEGSERMGAVRVRMAEEAGAQGIVTACPFCLVNLEDAIKTTGRAGRMEVLDLAELVARCLEGGPAPQPGPSAAPGGRT